MFHSLRQGRWSASHLPVIILNKLKPFRRCKEIVHRLQWPVRIRPATESGRKIEFYLLFFFLRFRNIRVISEEEIWHTVASELICIRLRWQLLLLLLLVIIIISDLINVRRRTRRARQLVIKMKCGNIH